MTNPKYLSIGILLFFCLALSGCKNATTEVQSPQPLEVPRGYMSRLQIEVDDQVFGFGPFVGYYFKPTRKDDLTRLDFVCFNEKSYYSSEMKKNSLLYKGTALFRQLPESGVPVPQSGDRIVPLFFSEAPAHWIDSRPEPKEAFVHFHSVYNQAGATTAGYWIRHIAQASFIYNMGGRVNDESPLYHEVTPGVDHSFARIIEFDHGPAQQ